MSQDTLQELASLCAQLREEQRAVEQAEATLKAHEAALRRIAEEDIPGLMTELGVSKITLETGESITVALEVYASIPKTEQAQAFGWLENNNFGSLIKTEVSVRYGREGLNNAQRLASELTERGLEPELTRSVHASTLKAFLKEQLAAGAAVPLELFGARAVNVAKIK